MNCKEKTGSKKTTEEEVFFPYENFKDISKMMAGCCENMQGIPDCRSLMMKSPDEEKDASETAHKK